MTCRFPAKQELYRTSAQHTLYNGTIPWMSYSSVLPLRRFQESLRNDSTKKKHRKCRSVGHIRVDSSRLKKPRSTEKLLETVYTARYSTMQSCIGELENNSSKLHNIEMLCENHMLPRGVMEKGIKHLNKIDQNCKCRIHLWRIWGKSYKVYWVFFWSQNWLFFYI